MYVVVYTIFRCYGADTSYEYEASADGTFQASPDAAFYSTDAGTYVSDAGLAPLPRVRRPFAWGVFASFLRSVFSTFRCICHDFEVSVDV